MSKKLISLVLAAMAMTAVAGCNNNKKPSESSETGSPTETTEPGSESSESSETSETEPDPLPEEYNILDHWKGNMEEEFYTVKETENGITIDYENVEGEDMGGWRYVARSFSYDAADVARFTEYKKVSFTGKLETTSGSNIVMVKVEGAGGTFERRFEFKAEVSTYEFSLNFVSDWTQVSQILFFANRSINEVGNGKITLSKMVLSKAEVNPDYDIASDMPAVPQGYTFYNGGDEVSVMYRWGYNAEGEIATAEEGGKYTFSWAQGGKGQWSFVSGWVKDGEASMKEQGLKSLHFEVKGPEGLEVLFKFEDKGNGGNKVEKSATMTGGVDVVDVDISAVINAGTGAFMALIFPAPGATEFAAAGAIEMTKCYIDKADIIVPEVPSNKANFAAAYLEEVSYKPNHVQIETENHVSTVTFALPGGMFWWDNNLQFPVKLHDDISWSDNFNYNRFVGKFTSTVAMTIVIKPYDNNAWEQRIVLEAGVAKDVDFTVNGDVTAELFAKPIVMFLDADRGEGGKPDALSGVLTMEGFRAVKAPVNVGYEGAVRLTNVNPHDKYTLDHDESGNLKVTTKEVGWNFLEANISSYNVAKYNHYSVVINSTAATHIGIKPADANEQKVALKAGDNEVSFYFLTPMNEMFGKFVMFIAFEDGDAAEATLTFKNFVIEEAELPAPVGNYNGLANTAGGAVGVVLALGAEKAVLKVNDQDVGVTAIAYNKDTQVLTLTSAGAGEVTAKYDVVNDKLYEVTVAGDMAALVTNNGEIELKHATHFFNCDGTTAQLQSQFKRRYMSGSWQVDTGNADRYVKNEEQAIAGSSMKRRGFGSGAVATNLNADLPGNTGLKAFAFWVYNPSANDIGLRIWMYRAASLGSNAELTNGTNTDSRAIAKAGQWTYVVLGFDSTNFNADTKIFNFQIADFTNSGVALSFDNIAVF